MHVDLISSLDAVASEPAQSASSGSQGEFPNVLRSTLGDEDSSAQGGSESGEQANRDSARPESDAESDSAGARNASSEGEASSSSSSDVDSETDAETREAQSGSGADAASERTETAGSEATAEAAALGAAAAAILERARVGAGLETISSSDGRPTELDANESGGRGREASIADAAAQDVIVRAGEVVDEEIVEEIVSDVIRAGEAAGLTDGSLEEVASGERAVASEGAIGIPTEARSSDSQEVPATAEDEIGREFAERGFESGAEDRGDDARRDEQALFDRAAEGAQSAGVDANLRQAAAQAEAALRAPETVAIDGAAAIANPVAGTLTETTTAAPPGGTAAAAASDAISVQTEWLATRGGGTARLLLHPPELGEIAIRVTLRGGAVDVVMVAQEVAAQTAAEDQSDRLSQAFANRDLRMESFEVRRGDPDELPDAGLGQFSDSGARNGDRAEDENEAGGRDGRAVGPGIAGSDPSRPSVAPRILSTGPEPGVDLRI